MFCLNLSITKSSKPLNLGPKKVEPRPAVKGRGWGGGTVPMFTCGSFFVRPTVAIEKLVFAVPRDSSSCNKKRGTKRERKVHQFSGKQSQTTVMRREHGVIL